MLSFYVPFLLGKAQEKFLATEALAIAKNLNYFIVQEKFLATEALAIAKNLNFPFLKYYYIITHF